MCGICGWYGSLAPELESRVWLDRLSAQIAHRGPDDQGQHLDAAAGVALGHRRLAIIDLSPASRQPMTDAASGVVLAYNGEIYNYQELRAELEAHGHRFGSRGDVEVVLRALVEWRERAFEKLAGMFAIAAWDPRSRTFWLARDALGLKPLYYTVTPGGGIAFASEVKALLELPFRARRLDRRGLVDFLEFGYRIDEDATMFAGIARLAPAEVIGWRDNHEIRRFKHFEPPCPEPGPGPTGEERAEELVETLRRVVAQHLIADVPVGLLLSGGLDSSLVAALAARGSDLTTVSMGFLESGHDEREWGQRVAEVIGSRHLDVAIAPEEVAREIESSAWVFDDLFADWGTITTRILYRRCRELGLKVVLVGEGADELFAGYPSFRRALGRWTTWRAASLYRAYVSRRWGSSFGRFRAALDELAGDDAAGNLFEAVRRFEVRRQLPGNYVMKVDKASMSVSLEARAPYLDRRIAELALRTPPADLLRGETEKWVLRRAAEIDGQLPREIVSRPKLGGSIAASWLDEIPSFRAFAAERVLRPGGWAERVGLRAPLERYFAGTRVLPLPSRLSHLGHLGWRLLLLELWAEHYRVEESA